MTRLLIAGSRTIGYVRGGNSFEEPQVNSEELQHVLTVLDFMVKNVKATEIISGTAKGADRIGETVAALNEIKVTQFRPDWEMYGKRAGFIRNKEMVEYCDKAIVLWDGASKGAAHTLSLLEKSGKDYFLWRMV
jgi:hypothetical protein